ncbi:MAG: segregation/condensation protein A [Candidatus Micrarchaeota archaeon]
MSAEENIEKMILKPMWKEMLMEMMASERLDPWNIDITLLADSFLRNLKKMKTLELYVPANLILAAAILLKYKSNALKIAEELPIQDVHAEESGTLGACEEIPKLELVSRIPPKAPIALEDLLKEMERIIAYDNPVEPKPKKIEEIITIAIPRFDIEERMSSVFLCLKQKADSEGWATFSGLLENRDANEIVNTLMPLLHLSQKKIIDLRQDDFFGEIFIRIK